MVDRHIHFWDTDRFDYPWLQGFTEPNEPLPTATEEVPLFAVVSLLTPSFVARQTGYALSGDWSVGDRATNEHYAPLETFEERFGELLALTRSLGFDAIDLWTAHLGRDGRATSTWRSQGRCCRSTTLRS